MTSRTARPRSMLLRNGLSERSGIPGMRSVGDELAVIRGDNRVNSMVQERFESTGFRSDFFTVAMVRVGTIVGRLDHQSFQLNSGDIALSPPQRIKHLVGIEKDTEIWVICFTVDFLRRLKLRGLSEHMSIFAAANLPVIHLNEEQLTALCGVFERLEGHIDRVWTHSYGMELVKNTFVEFLLETAHYGTCNGEGIPQPVGRKEELVAGFTELATRHHLKQRNLSFYSEHLFVTTKHLSETVKEVTGRTAGQVLDGLLLVESQRLLDETNLMISEVAFQMGFADPSQFSKFFHRMTGTSPRAHRQSLPPLPVAFHP
ncbi:MAG: AraC family transcriptional regulator [Flavobacteriales bacterium]|nr:MAG: AraC family transcriptional regulator [Flavobacteriales bacterium]